MTNDTNDTWDTDRSEASAAARGSPAMQKPRDASKGVRAYHPDAIASARRIIRDLASEDAAAIVSALLALRHPGSGEDAVPVAALGHAAGFGDDVDVIWDRIETADQTIQLAFGLTLVAETDARTARRRNGALRSKGLRDDTPDPVLVRPESVILSAAFVSLLDEPHPVPCHPDDLPVPDAATAAWIATVRSAALSGGRQYALRVSGPGREARDFAGLVAADGTRVAFVTNVGPLALALAILRAELHAGSQALVMIVDDEDLFQAPADDKDDDDDSTSSWVSAVSKRAPNHDFMRGIRNVYIRRAPAAGALPRAFDGLVGGIIGPMGFDRGWAESIVKTMVPGISAKGTSALLAQVRDPRDASAIASAAIAAAAGNDVDLDEACAFVARSFGARPGGLLPAPHPPAFDLRLLVVCDQDIGLLMDRATHLARNGGRVLFWGPPGGGKSSCAQVLGRKMGDGRPTIMVAPADVLAYRWGAMEKRLAALWTKATTEGAILVIDELDSLCGARGSGGDGNNGHLVRILTDEWLRHFDVHPSVPVIATVNDPAAVDPAIRRRFAFIIEIGDTLSADRERLAWTSIFGITPPVDWKPCGAAVSDFAMAKSRCRMLGLTDAADLADAVLRSRDARLGSRAATRGLGSVKGAVH